MPRGGHKVKPIKAAPVEASALSRILGAPKATKPTRTNTDLRPSIPTPPFLSRSYTETKLAGPVLDQLPLVRESSRPQAQNETVDPLTRSTDLPVDSTEILTDLGGDKGYDTIPSSLPNEFNSSLRPISSRTPSVQFAVEEEIYEAALDDTLEDLAIEEAQSSASSSYSRDSLSIYSSDSASIYSSASSVYSYDDCGLKEFDRYGWNTSTELMSKDSLAAPDTRLPGRPQYQQRPRTGSIRRLEPQDAAARESSSLAKKAALFKNSRLPPQLPSFSTSLPSWAMVVRAAQSSLECYDSQALTRRGTYTPADNSKDIKAMIIDDQFIDDSRLVIVSIRGTQCKSLGDWAVNKASYPAKPVGFLDDEENACHAGFLQVTKAMVAQVAAQLQQYPASSERPSLLFTGHSAGGAVAAMLYSHMLSTTVNSELTALASQFPSINCVTFGAPPLSLAPLPKRDHGCGVFISFANEGDPVLRLSNAAYVKSLVKLMTASPPSSVTSAAPPVKVVRRSRGSAVIRTVVSTAPPTPWEELPLWPTPPAPLTNAGEVVLLRDNETGCATASRVTPEDLSEVIFGDLAQHTIEMYIRRVKDVALSAMTGRM
jgi:hypothetical protein